MRYERSERPHGAARLQAALHAADGALVPLDELDADARVAAHHRLHAVRGHLLEMTGDGAAARRSYRLAGRETTSLAERRYLDERATRLTRSSPGSRRRLG
jgi:predicted RNA polymerase sigma factor